MNLDFVKVCGKHSAIYEAYYKQIDPKSSGAIEAMTAAKFLKKSGLSDVVLSRVWDLSDPNGKGFLDKPGFFVALKLVSLAQTGQVINMSNIYMETANPPKVGDLPKIMPSRIHTVPLSSGGVTSGDWSISVIDRLKYEQLFETLKPMGGMLPGNKVKGVLMDSKLPMDTLGKIWDLADQDKDGNLDKHEFIVAMHLVYQTLEKRTVPDVLPPELRKSGSSGPPPPKPAPPVVGVTGTSMPRAPSGEGFADGGFVANFPKDIAPPPAIPPLPAAVPHMTRVPPVGGAQPLIQTDPLIPIGAPPSVTANADWVVIPSELKRYEVMFRDSDRDKDGLVSGLEVKNVFLQSGVPQNCLAHIWALCDTNQSGKLTLEQFALAMWMVERKQNGIEPPQVLTANMVPPSMRGIVAGVDLQPQVEPKPAYTNPELEMISKEIEELAKERRALETEIAQKEADIRIKSGEVRSLQSELDTLSATLKQLENQRGEAQKRLDDLKAQGTEYQAAVAYLNVDINNTKTQVNKIRDQCQKQEETINEQEGELNTKRSELQKLKDEETALQKEYDENNRELQKLTQHLQNTQLQISSVRSMVTQLMETQRQMTDALLMCRAAIDSQDTEIVSEYQLKIEPDLDDARKTLEKKIEEPKPDPFDDNTSSSVIKTSNGFATNGFGNDPFVATNTTSTARGGFDDSFTVSSGFVDSGFDAFGSSSTFVPQKDPFGGDAFGASKPNPVTPEPGKDDFGSDPFAALHAPTGQGQVLSPNAQKSGPPPRPESPSPALPPKKSKVPPPRPAPPRPLQGPARPTQPAMDAFGAPTTSGGFADFADFDNKQSTIPSPSPLPTLFASSIHTLSSSSSLFDTSTTLSSTTSSSIPTAAVTNNHLKRSHTPLQQAASAFSTTSNITNNNSRSSVVSGPTDFSDDPFKDYRYEDPFSIKDPFADEDVMEDPDKIFKDDLSSDDDSKSMDTKKKNIQLNKTTSNPSHATTKSTATSSTEFLEQFAAFNLNPSPVPSQTSTASVKKSTTIIDGFNLNPSPVPSQNSAASLKKSPRSTPVLPAASSAAGASLFDDFANFDAFATKSSTNVGSLNAINNNNKNDTNTTISNKSNEDSFFDAFNDNLNSNTNKIPIAETQKGFSTADANIFFDAFGDTKSLNTNNLNMDAAHNFDAFSAVAAATTNTNNGAIKKSSKIFDDFNDNTFEDDFFKAKSDITNDKNLFFNHKNKSINNTINEEFAKFDAFAGDATDFDADFPALNNSVKPLRESVFLMPMIRQAVLGKTTNFDSSALAAVEDGANLAEKFVADYSKPETFDADLQEALKRSLTEK